MIRERRRADGIQIHNNTKERKKKSFKAARSKLCKAYSAAAAAAVSLRCVAHLIIIHHARAAS